MGLNGHSGCRQQTATTTRCKSLEGSTSSPVACSTLRIGTLPKTAAWEVRGLVYVAAVSVKGRDRANERPQLQAVSFYRGPVTVLPSICNLLHLNATFKCCTSDTTASKMAPFSRLTYCRYRGQQSSTGSTHLACLLKPIHVACSIQTHSFIYTRITDTSKRYDLNGRSPLKRSTPRGLHVARLCS